MTATPLTSPPKSFGRAKVAFDSGGWQPSRQGNTLFFPFRFDQADIYPLQNGEQFLMVPKTIGYYVAHGLYFGGTDEQPFITELSSRHYLDTLRNEGEAAFYEALVPATIKVLRERLGSETKRQGDIFAHPLPLDWMQMCAEYRRHQRSGKRRMVTGSGARHVLGTGHLLRGCWSKREPVLRHNDQLVHVYTLVGQGTLSAPDHADLVLEGPHALDRNRDVGFGPAGD